MKEITTGCGMSIDDAMKALVKEAQTEDCFTDFNGVVLAADRRTSASSLVDKYYKAIAENKAKAEQRSRDDLIAQARQYVAQHELNDFWSAVAYSGYKHAIDKLCEVMADFTIKQEAK